MGANGGVSAGYVYSGINLGNTDDELILLDSTLTEIDRVDWDGGMTFPDPVGASMELSRDREGQNETGSNWCEAESVFGDGDLGTPGAGNDCCVALSCYYDFADLTDAATTRGSLHVIIDDHFRTPLSSPDSWAILEMADEDPGDSTRILDVYKNASYMKVGGGGGPYSREHSWPDSYGFPVDTGTGKYPRSDYHAIFLADAGLQLFAVQPAVR